MKESLSSLAIHIKLPSEAIVPLLVGAGILLVMVFAGAALADWKRKHPQGARIFGLGMALGLTGVAAYRLALMLPQGDENDRVHEGIQLVTMFDGPIVGFLAAIGVVMWRYTNQRWIALGTGLVIGLALFAKPFIAPLSHIWDGHARQWGNLDLEHIAFFAPGLVLVIVALVVALPKPAVAKGPA
ncbi:MAG: hypothetical protein H6Q90_1586 [Deltaproteobacteria bacterium]|nr:hypothetical protein [Deltaproteobacteria bacterium]